MGKKNRPSSQANLLREQGVDALGVNMSAKVNPVGFYNPDKTKYKIIWSNYDFNQCCSRYKWKNLPNGLTSWNLERMLYFRGTLAGFVFAGRFYILPYVITGPINPYGLPVGIKPITYNGRPVAGENDFFGEKFELPVDVFGDATRDYGAVILYDSLPYNTSSSAPSRYALNQIIINEIVETFARININVVISNKKILLQCKDAKQADVIRKELEIAFGSDSPFAVLTSPLESQSIQSSSDFNADELFNTIKNYDSIRCFMSGIRCKSFGTEKKERVVTGELAGSEEQSDLILDIGFELRKEFADLCNRKWGLNIVVEKRSDEYDEQVNGNNKTKEEEESESDENEYNI